MNIVETKAENLSRLKSFIMNLVRKSLDPSFHFHKISDLEYNSPKMSFDVLFIVDDA